MYCSHERVALSSSLRLKLTVIEKMENPTCFQIVTNYSCLNNNRHCRDSSSLVSSCASTRVVDCVCLFAQMSSAPHLQYAVHDKPLASGLHMEKLICSCKQYFAELKVVKYLRLGSGHYCQTSNHTESRQYPGVPPDRLPSRSEPADGHV